MNVLPYVHELLKTGPVHVTLIDPDKQDFSGSARIAESAEKGGTHLLLVGGTTGVDHTKLDRTIVAVRENAGVPIVTFPTSSSIISDRTDAILFMSLMNSNDVKYAMREAVMGAPTIKRMGIEAIPTGYVVVEPGMLVGEVGNVELIGREDLDTAVKYAVGAQMFGMELFYLEGGSGVDQPIPSSLIAAVKRSIDIPLVVGGGISGAARAGDAVRAGADIIVTGNILERSRDIEGTISHIIREMCSAWKMR